MTLDALYDYVYDLVSLIFTREEITALVFQSDTSIKLPTTDDPYIVVGYTPTILRKTGNSTSGDITDPGGGDPTYLVRYTPWEGEVEVRQVNGDGELLKIILDSLETQYVFDFLSPIGLTIKDVEIPILSIPFRTNNEVNKESIVSPVFSFYDSRREELEWIEDVEISGEIASPDGEIRYVEISKDLGAP